APPSDFRRHVVGRERWRARRHEGGRRGPRVLHRPRRHLGLRAEWHAPGNHPNAGDPGERGVRRSGSTHVVLYGSHVGLHAAREDAGPASSVVSRPEGITMKFGTFLLMQSPSARSSEEIYRRGIDVAQAAEALGFRSVWLAEHHFSTYGYLSRPAQLATHIAAKTTRLRVGTAVIVVPLQHPLVVTEEIAT